MATYYWVGGSGTWDAATTTNWSSTSGGSGGAGSPTTADTVNFDINSGTGTVATGVGATAGTTVLNSATISLVLGANLTTTQFFFFTQGAIDLNNFNATFVGINASNSNVRTIRSGTGQFYLTGDNSGVLSINNVANLTYFDRATYNISGNPSTGTRTIQHGLMLVENLEVNINVTAGTDTVSLTANSFNLNFTGFSGTLSNSGRNIYGSLTLSSGMTLSAGTGKTDFRGSSPTKTITTNGRTLDFPIEFVGGGSVWTLQDNLTLGSTRVLTLNAGTLDGNNKNVTIGTFTSTSTSTRTLAIGSGTWVVQGSGATAWDTVTTNFTVGASTGTISMAGATAKTFVGSGKIWPTLNQGGAGALTITGSNTFTSITNTVQPATITLTSGTTQTVGAFGVSGTAGNLITLNASAAGSRATLSDSTGTNSVSFVSLQDINATGGATWDAFVEDGNIDAGNNLGWDFLSFASSVFRAVLRPILKPIFLRED